MKRNLAVAVPAIIITTMLVVGQTMNGSASQNSKAEQEIMKANKEYDEAILRQDAAVFDRLMADDFFYTTSDGEVVTKAQELTNAKSGETKYESAQSHDVRMRVYGDAAVVTGRWKSKGVRRGKEFDENERYTTVYAKRGGSWQLVADHTSRIAQK
ncbi:MAG TPA: nuclear transport factor 2 family protein [Pyrinomonadaceae bacterium]|nr:nuclear transport factor 2 family protein [Pyrinomonadaceae bacterium]